MWGAQVASGPTVTLFFIYRYAVKSCSSVMAKTHGETKQTCKVRGSTSHLFTVQSVCQMAGLLSASGMAKTVKLILHFSRMVPLG